MEKFIKIYGERNTNTNYFSKLLELNLKLIQVPGTAPKVVKKIQKISPGNELFLDMYFRLTYGKNLGWKHAVVKSQEELNHYNLVDSNLYFLTITKNPYSWLLSLYRRPYHQYYSDKPSFEDFLKRQWKTVGRDNLGKNVSSPVELWNLKNKSYLQLNPKNAINTTTEEIFRDPQGLICEVSQKFSIDTNSEKFINYERSTKDQSKDSAYYRDYYLLEKWKEKLSQEAIEIINESVDQDLMNHFGYKMLS